MLSYTKEIIRKCCHFIAIGLALVWLYLGYDEWKRSVYTAIGGGIVIFFALYAFSRIPGLTQKFIARKKGEFAFSFAAYVAMYCVVATLLWGFLGQKHLVCAAILAWGPGDAAAALVGRKLGKHKIGKEKKKSLEGSLSMFVLSVACVFSVLFLSGLYGAAAALLIALITVMYSPPYSLSPLLNTQLHYHHITKRKQTLLHTEKKPVLLTLFTNPQEHSCGFFYSLE